MATQQAANGTANLPLGWRLKVGMVLFVLALVPWGLLPPLIFYQLPIATVASLTAAGVVLQKVVLIAAVAVLGKSGFAYLKGRVFQRLAPPAHVGPLRYRVGLVLLIVALAQGLLETYASHIVPHLVANRLWVDILADVLLVVSVFVLGGNFWDKLRALFVREARVVFPEDAADAVAARPLTAAAG